MNFSSSKIYLKIKFLTVYLLYEILPILNFLLKKLFFRNLYKKLSKILKNKWKKIIQKILKI